ASMLARFRHLPDLVEESRLVNQPEVPWGGQQQCQHRRQAAWQVRPPGRGVGDAAEIRMDSVRRWLEGKEMTLMPGRRKGGEQFRGSDPGAVGGGIGEPGRDEQNLRRLSPDRKSTRL